MRRIAFHSATTRECLRLALVQQPVRQIIARILHIWGAYDYLKIIGLFYRAPLQKGPIILRSLLIEATPYVYI